MAEDPSEGTFAERGSGSPPPGTAPAVASSSRRRRMWIAAAVTGAIALALGALTVRAVQTSEAGLDLDPVNQRAPSFALPILDGGVLDLATLRGKPVLLNFWASWCHTCKQEAPALAAGWKRWGPRGVVFVGVASSDSREWARRFVVDYRLGYTNLFDGPGEVGRAYGLTGHPETFFIGPDGYVKAKWIGPIDESVLDRVLGALVGAR